MSTTIYRLVAVVAAVVTLLSAMPTTADAASWSTRQPTKPYPTVHLEAARGPVASVASQGFAYQCSRVIALAPQRISYTATTVTFQYGFDVACTSPVQVCIDAYRVNSNGIGWSKATSYCTSQNLSVGRMYIRHTNIHGKHQTRLTTWYEYMPGYRSTSNTITLP